MDFNEYKTSRQNKGLRDKSTGFILTVFYNGEKVPETVTQKS